MRQTWNDLDQHMGPKPPSSLCSPPSFLEKLDPEIRFFFPLDSLPIHYFCSSFLSPSYIQVKTLIVVVAQMRGVCWLAFYREHQRRGRVYNSECTTKKWIKTPAPQIPRRSWVDRLSCREMCVLCCLQHYPRSFYSTTPVPVYPSGGHPASLSSRYTNSVVADCETKSRRHDLNRNYSGIYTLWYIPGTYVPGK